MLSNTSGLAFWTGQKRNPGRVHEVEKFVKIKYEQAQGGNGHARGWAFLHGDPGVCPVHESVGMEGKKSRASGLFDYQPAQLSVFLCQGVTIEPEREEVPTALGWSVVHK